MTRNVAQFGRRELQAHRRFVTGVTASVPSYVEVDQAGNKEWVADVYLSPLDAVGDGIVEKAIIDPIARNLVTDIRQPVLLDRSREGRYVIIGRAKNLAAGLDIGGGVPTGTFVETQYNYAELGLRFIADVDWELEPLQATPGTELQSDVDEPLQVIRGRNAFGRLVVGPEDEVDPDTAPAAVQPAPSAVAIERRFRVSLEPLQLDPETPLQADPDEPLQGTIREVIEVPA